MSNSLKRCAVCGERKPHSEFYPRKGKPGGYCKPCTKKENLEWQRRKKEKEIGLEQARENRKRRKHFDRLAAIDKTLNCEKVCRVCEIVKSLDDFYQTVAGDVDCYCKPCRLKVDKKLAYKTAYSCVTKLMVAARQRSRLNSWEFNLTKEFLSNLWDEQEGKCYYTDVSLTYDGKRKTSALSIDRVDSSKGYMTDNVVLCCRIVNEMKSNMSVDAFLNMCRTILRINEERSQRWLGFQNGNLTTVQSRRDLSTVKLAPCSSNRSGALGELLEPSAHDGGGNQQPSCVTHIGSAEGSETRAVSGASDNQLHERPASYMDEDIVRH